MDNWITGALAVLVLGAFLIGLAASIDSIPFFVIVIVVMACAIVDFFQSTRNPGNRPRR
jgi:fucose permease